MATVPNKKNPLHPNHEEHGKLENLRKSEPQQTSGPPPKLPKSPGQPPPQQDQKHPSSTHPPFSCHDMQSQASPTPPAPCLSTGNHTLSYPGKPQKK